jgi:hypothetical protein
VPKKEKFKTLPACITLNEAYKMLSDSDKLKVRTQLEAIGLSQPTFYRWLAADSVPFIWRDKFRECLNEGLRNNGKQLAP